MSAPTNQFIAKSVTTLKTETTVIAGFRRSPKHAILKLAVSLPKDIIELRIPKDFISTQDFSLLTASGKLIIISFVYHSVILFSRCADFYIQVS